jgi:hypothetical protein
MLIGALTEVSYTLPDDATEEQWQQALLTLVRMEHSVAWWLGDALNFGDAKFADAAKTIQEQLEGKYTYGTLADFKWVAGAIDRERRHPNVKWSHHRLIAKLSQNQQITWLERSAKNAWSRVELQRELQKEGLVPVPRPSVKQCRGLSIGKQIVHCSGCKSNSLEMFFDAIKKQNSTEEKYLEYADSSPPANTIYGRPYSITRAGTSTTTYPVVYSGPITGESISISTTEGFNPLSVSDEVLTRYVEAVTKTTADEIASVYEGDYGLARRQRRTVRKVQADGLRPNRQRNRVRGPSGQRKNDRG